MLEHFHILDMFKRKLMEGDKNCSGIVLAHYQTSFIAGLKALIWHFYRFFAYIFNN